MFNYSPILCFLTLFQTKLRVHVSLPSDDVTKVKERVLLAYQAATNQRNRKKYLFHIVMNTKQSLHYVDMEPVRNQRKRNLDHALCRVILVRCIHTCLAHKYSHEVYKLFLCSFMHILLHTSLAHWIRNRSAVAILIWSLQIYVLSIKKKKNYHTIRLDVTLQWLLNPWVFINIK